MNHTERADLIAHTILRIQESRNTFSSLPPLMHPSASRQQEEVFYALGREVYEMVMAGATGEDVGRIVEAYRARKGGVAA